MTKRGMRSLLTLAVGVCIAAGAWAGPLISDSDLVIYYSYDSVSTTVADESGKGNDGAVVGNVTANAGGVRGGAAQFAESGYLDLDGPNFPASDIPTSAFTLAAWCKVTDTDASHAIFNARAADNTFLIHPEIRDADYRLVLRGAGSTTICSFATGTSAFGEWVHYAATYDQSTGKCTLYINGQVLNQVDATNAVPLPSDWGVGARVGYNVDNARPFTGLMDEFYIFKRALSATEIEQLYTLYDPNGDDDGDGLTNQEETDLGTNPDVADTDSDGLSDGDEVNTHGTDPLLWDTDGDAASDGYEVQEGYDPLDENDTPPVMPVPVGPVAVGLMAASLLALGARSALRRR